MSTLTRRLQVLLDESRYARLEREAERSSRSVAAVVRDAIDLAVPGEMTREQAADILLDAPPMAVEDWDDMKEQVRGGGRDWRSYEPHADDAPADRA